MKIKCKECKSKCKLCKGTGNYSESWVGEQWDRGDGVMYGSASWTLRRCPHGCIDTMRTIL